MEFLMNFCLSPKEYNTITTHCQSIGLVQNEKYTYVLERFFVLGHLALTVLVTTIDAQWEGMGDVGSARYEPALLPPCPTIRVLSYSN